MSEPTRQIDPDLLRLLGRLVIQWSAVEALLNELFSFMIGADKGMAYVLSQNVSGATVVDSLRTATRLRIKDPKGCQHILDMLTRIDTVRAERNALVHGVWATHMSEAGTAVVQTVRWDRAEVVKHELVTASDLNEVIQEIGDIIVQLRTMDRMMNFTGRPASSIPGRA